MRYEILSRAYGWEGTLRRHNKDRNNWLLPRIQRHAADKAHYKITQRLKDTTLMGMRERLIRASQAGDERAMHNITRQIRDYLKEDQETGLYEAARTPQ